MSQPATEKDLLDVNTKNQHRTSRPDVATSNEMDTLDVITKNQHRKKPTGCRNQQQKRTYWMSLPKSSTERADRMSQQETSRIHPENTTQITQLR
jgi:hypothetical protein